jgi:2-iminobutanoate/2-iminopropanoate deaminase
MPARVINDKMPTPLGPYSQAVAASGELVFISGQPGIDATSGEVPAGFEAQFRNAFQNLARVVAAAGLEMSDVVKTTIYLADASHFGTLNALFENIFRRVLRRGRRRSCNFHRACSSQSRPWLSEAESDHCGDRRRSVRPNDVIQ